MDNKELLKRVNNLEVTAMVNFHSAKVILDECQKIKQLLGNVKPVKKNGWTKEEEQKFMKRRMKVFNKGANNFRPTD